VKKLEIMSYINPKPIEDVVRVYHAWEREREREREMEGEFFQSHKCFNFFTFHLFCFKKVLFNTHWEMLHVRMSTSQYYHCRKLLNSQDVHFTYNWWIFLYWTHFLCCLQKVHDIIDSSLQNSSWIVTEACKRTNCISIFRMHPGVFCPLHLPLPWLIVYDIFMLVGKLEFVIWFSHLYLISNAF